MDIRISLLGVTGVQDWRFTIVVILFFSFKQFSYLDRLLLVFVQLFFF